MKNIAFFDTKSYDRESFDRENNGRYDIRYFETRLTAAVLPMLVGTPLAVGGCPRGGQGRSGKC